VKAVLVLRRGVRKPEEQPKIPIKVTQITRSSHTDFSRVVYVDSIFSPEKEVKSTVGDFNCFFI